MEDRIRDAILSIIREKRSGGDVLPYATSIEVARRLRMNAAQVEEMARDIKGIASGRTINYDYYYE